MHPNIKKILVIEDNDDDVFLLRNCLQQIDITCPVDRAVNGQDALVKLDENKYDIIFLDYNLPDSNAIDLIRDVLKHAGKDFLPIITMTGVGGTEVAVELMKLGVIDHLLKGELKPDRLNMALLFAMEKISNARKQKIYISELERMGLYDSLTSLPNQNLMYDRLEQVIKTARRAKTGFSLCYMDLNDFKPINDTYGHATGNLVLRTIGQRLKYQVREADTVARVGGDEFVIILPGVGSREDAITFVEKLQANIDKPVPIENIEVEISSSIGITMFPDHGTNLNDILNIADLAMYQAKRNKKPFYIPR